MASAMRSQARNVRTAEPTALDARRYLNRRAAAYVGLWTQSIRLETYRASVLRWAANTLFVGGNYAAAFEAYELAIAKTERPSPDTPAGLRANKRLDVAELEAAYCLLMLGENERALERFKTLEQIGYAFTVRARRRHAVMRCLMTGRSLSQDAFTFRRAGRNYARKCWFLAFDVDGEKRVFFETRAPRGGSQFTGVQGTDPTQPFTPSTDEYEIDLTLRGHYLLVDGMAKATWAVWGKTADRSFLANEVTSASNALIVTLRGLEGRYTALVSGNQLKPTQFVARRWQARLQFLEIKMARQDYRGVVSEIRLFELRGEFETASPTVRAKVESLRRTAEARAPGK